ncbi:hypothetical protein MKW92_000621 [Papaver armeniacum]|nr:hypothetical protein MKW92_000621 [Papaver armeniacum]
MDDGELEFSNQVLNMSDSMDDDFFNGLLSDNGHACTHTHTCNPPGPDLSHTHTCVHVHTKILPPEDKTTTEDTDESVEMKSKKRAPGNREAVRKYREKKKARAASLEDEVARLRNVNQQLMRRLQGQAGLEQEVARLKCLLVDIRGRIEGEIGSFPYQKPTKGIGGVPQHMPSSNMVGAYAVNHCDIQCDDQVYCLHPGLDTLGVDETGGFHNEVFGPCDAGYMPCPENTSSGYKDLLACGQTNAGSTANGNPSAAAKKRKGGVRTPATV